ncbi:MAG: hypothetical protein HRT61_23885 [Ekhidna sp.]|nr:hypothetical protein [Ekhidna sp.]
MADTNDIQALTAFVEKYGVDFKSEIGTPLIETIAWNGTPSMVEFLLSKKPKLEESLLRAIVNGKGCAAIMDLLLRHGADPNIRGAHFSALELARKRENSEAEELLLSHGATL